MSDLQVEDTKVGDGTEAQPGNDVTLHYTGTLSDGSKFDSSHDRGEGLNFTLGSGQVIEGWDRGVTGMRVGGTRTLVIPPSMAYGERGVPPIIPPNATLHFDVELLEVK
ncbi:hypothetical protein GCM10027271_58800 [Saccharopolyspora gloriosae]|uniref:Peptidyl-prolyl cis-trans isomerase n=1 Tax=Saccharopolyspora gloriosae TaxID=455344 RepID=A0A840NC89_9PSEU|nr:FKBP-type peptidyl-prolyl cis-trans isomerase [Saccharopolyspora gloriosae]